MGKQSRKNKKLGSKPADNNINNDNNSNNTKVYNNDTAIYILMSQELKEDGNKLFQTKDYEEAILNYEKALNFLPRNHTDVSNLHSNIAACYMQMGITNFPRAIHECNLALEVTPKYIKALLKRSRCYEALNQLNLSFRDANTVLDIEPMNLMAMEIVDRVKTRMDSKLFEDSSIHIPLNEKIHKKKSNKIEKKSVFLDEENKTNDQSNEKVEEISEVKKFEKTSNDKEEEPTRVVKFVYREDIRFAKIPFNCDFFKLREIIHERFPISNGVFIKYLDKEGDMVTITTNEELRWAESSFSDQETIFRLYIFEVNPDQDPFFDHFRKQDQKQNLGTYSSYIDDWILEFAQLFKNYVGFNSDSCLDLRELGMKLYSEAMEDTVTSEDAQELFQKAGNKFQEMAALALFNWGNVHMSRGLKRVFFSEDGSKESLVKHVKDSYEWAQMEYLTAGEKYEEAIKIKLDFYEGFLALAQVQFEKAKLSWYYALGTNINLETWDYNETVHLYNEAEDNLEKGMQIWEEMALKTKNVKLELKKTDLKEDETENMRSQMNVFWGTMLYERSIMEYKLGIPVWRESLEVCVEKFEISGASQMDIAVMIKNHCSNHDASEGLGFNIDEIVHAWNEMNEAKIWRTGVPSFRLGPLLRRRVSKIFNALEHA